MPNCIPATARPSSIDTSTVCQSSNEDSTTQAQALSPKNTHPAKEWIAPYHTYSGSSQLSEHAGTYTVHFLSNHTLAAHEEFLGFKVEGTHRGASYEAILLPDRRDQVRRDPGVEKILEGCPAHWRREANNNEAARAMLESDREEDSMVKISGHATTTIPKNIVSKDASATQKEFSVQKPIIGQEWIAPYRPYDGSQGPCRRYDRYTVNFFEGHTVAKHEEIVQGIGRQGGGQGWYQRILSEEERERVRRDPGVASVVQCGPAYWG